LKASDLLSRLAGEDTFGVDETQKIAERILQVKGPFTPRATSDLTHRKVAVTHLFRQRAEALGTREHSLEIVDREVHVIEVRSRRSRITIGSGVVHSKRYLAAPEVVPAWRDSHTSVIEQSGVEAHGIVEQVDGKNDSVESSGSHASL